MATTKISLKLWIDKKGERVLFAEADKGFVDFLFNIFALPFGNVTGFLKEKGMGGCLPSLYQSIENLSDAYFLPDQHKDFLLKPKVAVPGPQVPLLLPNVDSVESHESHESSVYFSHCCNNRYRETHFDRSRLCAYLHGNLYSPVSSSQQGYVKETVKYMVMDDLEVRPMFTFSFVTLLNEFNVEDVGAIEEKAVDLAMDQALQLLKASLQSKTVLTDVFLRPEAIETEESIKEEEAGGAE